MLRSILAVLAGIAALTATSFAIEFAINAVIPNALPEFWSKALMFGYGLACVTFGGYVTARTARSRPRLHAGIMAVLQAGLTLLAMVSPVGDHASQTRWIATAIVTIPAGMLGGVLWLRSSSPTR